MPVQSRRRYDVLIVREKSGQTRRIHAYRADNDLLPVSLETPHGHRVVQVAPGVFDIFEVRSGRAVRTRVRQD